MHGLGDNLYQRPFVRELARRREVYLSTPWPQLYADLPIEFSKPESPYRSQARNEASQPASVWSNAVGAPLKIWYGRDELKERSIVQSMAIQFGTGVGTMDLPPLPASPIEGEYVVVRPVTVRKEWANVARNPLPEYIHEATQAIRNRRIKVVSLADLKGGDEWLIGGPALADVRYERGELGVLEMLALVKGAKLVIGGVGWIVPAAMAGGFQALIIGGGQALHNSPQTVLGNPADYPNIRWLLPNPYCRCNRKKHTCRKVIPNFGKQLTRALANI